MFKILILILINTISFSYGYDRIKVNILADQDNPPYVFVQGGKLSGIYIELLNEVFSNMPEYDISLSEFPWKRGLSEIENGNSFAILPPYKISSRTWMDPYSETLFTEMVVLFCNNKFKFNAVNFPISFKNLKIAVNSGYALSDEFVRAKNEGIFTVEDGLNTEVNIKRLSSNRVDCFANDRLSTLYTINLLKEKEPEATYSNFSEVFIIKEQQAYIGFSKKSDKFPFKKAFIEKINIQIKKITSDKVKMHSFYKKFIH